MPFFIIEVILMFSLHKSVLFLIRQNNYYLDTELIDLEISHYNARNFPAIKQKKILPHVFKTSVNICYTIHFSRKKYFYLF